MEFTKKEVEIVGQAVTEAHAADIEQLNELQLTLIGGGMGEITFD